ncbi:MAG: helix-hairpin-helix domain-containing protein [Thermofilum sp.]
MIYIDVNEPEEIYLALRNRGMRVERKSIEWYDYVVEGKQGKVGVERKTIDDFIQSMIDGRLYYQSYKLSHDFTVSFIVIVGDFSLYQVERATFTGSIHENIQKAYIGALLGIGLRRSPDGKEGIVHPILLGSDDEFLTFMELLEKKLDMKDLYRLPVVGDVSESGNYMVAMLMCIPGVGREKAKTLYERFRSVENLVKASVEEIASVKGVGMKLAKRIYQTLRES